MENHLKIRIIKIIKSDESTEWKLRKLGSALARHTGIDESESINHLITRTSILLQKGLSALLLNRIPNHPVPTIVGEL